MTAHPEASIPQACGTWGDAKAAYRLLNEPDVKPEALQSPHRRVVSRQCVDRPVVLVLQDASDLDFTFHNKTGGLGKIGDGRGRGLIQHTALAVDPERGQAIGILHQSWHKRVERDENETASQRLARWRESQIWADTIEAIDTIQNCRLVHVCDSHGDCFGTFAAGRRVGVDLLVRAMHYDRKLVNGQGLLEHLLSQPPLKAKPIEVTLREQRDGRNQIKHAQRQVRLQARVSKVTLPPSRGLEKEASIDLHAILLCEVDAPQGIEPVRWVLLTTLSAESMDQVRQIVHDFALRWRIEEFHRVEKEGCRVENAQFDDAADLMRLASIKSVIAVRLLQLRDEAQSALREPEQLDTPARLAQIAPANWIAVVATAGKIHPRQLTVSQFYKQIAKRGGWLGRKSDGLPGWKTLWRGWSELWWMVNGYELGLSHAKRSG